MTSIGAKAFYNCSKLTGVYITDIAAWCNIDFAGDVNSTNSSNPLKYTHNLYLCNQLVTELIIPYGVTEIKARTFYNCSNLTSITIPDSVISIGSSAFCGCDSLTSVTIGSGVTSIEEDAFEYCYRMIEVVNKSSLTIPAGSLGYGYVAYYAKQVITDETDSGFIQQGDYLFYNANETYYLVCYTGTETVLVLPDNINGNAYSINQYAFYNCSNLTSITIPDSVISIGRSAFDGCSSLQYNEYDNAYYLGNSSNPYVILVDIKNTSITSIEIPTQTKVISYQAFLYCSSLTSITIPASVTSIGYNAFGGCSSLTSIIFEENSQLTSIGDEAFYNCSSLTSVTIPASVTSIETYTFAYCSSLTSVTIPASVNSIEAHAFIYCSSLTSITIPDSVTSIGYDAFGGCSSLTSIIIPASVTSIEAYAFNGCSKLTSVTFANPNGWYVRRISSTASDTSLTLTNSSKNATYLTSTYYNYHWKRK